MSDECMKQLIDLLTEYLASLPEVEHVVGTPPYTAIYAETNSGTIRGFAEWLIYKRGTSA